MKKCKINLIESNDKQKNFYLSPTADLLYKLASRFSNKTLIKKLKSNSEIEIVSLEPGENQWIEVEWNGCQNIINDNKKMIRMNYVKLVKISKLSSGDDSDALISIHLGWMLKEQLSFSNYKKRGMKVTALSKDDEQYNFSELFQSYDEIIKNILSPVEIDNRC